MNKALGVFESAQNEIEVSLLWMNLFKDYPFFV